MKSSIIASALVGTTVGQVFAGRRGGYLNSNAFPMNVVGEVSGAEVSGGSFSAYPMGSISMPSSFSFVGENTWVSDKVEKPAQEQAPTPLLGSSSESESNSELPLRGIGFNAKLAKLEAAEVIKDHITSYEGPTPEAQWNAYKKGFKVLTGADETATMIVNRQLNSYHNWASSFFGSQWVRQQGGIMGLEAPRRFEYSEQPWVPPKPIVSCPAGTPQFICDKFANAVSSYIPVGEQYNNPDTVDYLVNQNAIRAGYGGLGAVNRRVPLGPNKVNGPARPIGPAPTANAELYPDQLELEHNCVVEVEITSPFNPPFRNADRISRTHEVEFEFYLECVCTPQGLPQTDQCRIVTEEQTESVAAFPTGLYGGLYGEVPICTSFEEYLGDGQSGPTPCETVVQMGVTVPPAMKIPAVQIPQPGFTKHGFTNPQVRYGCEIEVELAFVMDSPMPWENNYYAFEVFYTQTSTLECQCDQFANPIVSTCRMGMENERNLELENSYGEFNKGGILGSPSEGPEGLLGQGLDKYPYTQVGNYNPNVVDQSIFPGFATGVPSNTNFQGAGFQGGFFPFRREGSEEEEASVEHFDALTLADYKDFVAKAVEQANEAATLANEAAVRAANAAKEGDANAAKAEARQAASYAAMADIAAEKANRLSQQVNQKILRSKRKNRKSKRRTEGTH